MTCDPSDAMLVGFIIGVVIGTGFTAFILFVLFLTNGTWRERWKSMGGGS